jgi:RimJ/RimL family protein N-acetyltransferase
MPLLFNLLSDPDRFHLWGHRRVLEEGQFYQSWQVWSSERMAAKFMIMRGGKPIGLIFDYERSVEDGHTKIATVLMDEATHRGAGVIATGLFCQWLFQSVSLNKVYLDVFGFNVPVLRMLRKLGVHEEMRRVRHRFWNGKYWDWIGFAIFREDLEDTLGKIFRGRSVTQSPTFNTRQIRITPSATTTKQPVDRYQILDQALLSGAG